jgi:hypothetical protein
MNRLEKLTVEWILQQSKQNQPIVTDEVLKTLKDKGLRKVVKYLEIRGIFTFTDYTNPIVIFIKKNLDGLSFNEKDGYRGGIYIKNGSVMILPITPIQ